MHLLFLTVFLNFFPCPPDTFVIDTFHELSTKGDDYGVTRIEKLPSDVEAKCLNKKVMLIGKSEFVDMAYERAYYDSMFGKPGYISRQNNPYDHCIYTVNEAFIWMPKAKRWKEVYRRKKEDE